MALRVPRHHGLPQLRDERRRHRVLDDDDPVAQERARLLPDGESAQLRVDLLVVFSSFM